MVNKKRNIYFIKSFFITLLLVIALALLIGCNKDEKKYSIMTPAGGPALSQIYVEKNSRKYEVAKISGPDNIPAHFNEAKHDVILAPTNIGIKLYNVAKSKNTDFAYEIAANIVFGNIYIASKEKLSLSDLNGKKIYAFGKNATPGISLRYILEKNNITPESIEYLPGGADAQTEFIKDSNIIALIPEPALSVAETKLKITVNRISILEEYNKIQKNDNGFPQASMFIKKSLKKSEKESILKDFKLSCENVNANPAKAAELANQLGYKQPQKVLEKAYPNLGIKFVSGVNCKKTVETYFTIIMEANPDMIGNKLPKEDFYFIGK